MNVLFNDCEFEIENFGEIAVNNDPDKYNIDGEIIDAEDIEVVVDDYKDFKVESVDEDGTHVEFKFGNGRVECLLGVSGKSYHYSGRNSYGEWIEPEEHGFNCTGVSVEWAYYYDDEVEDQPCHITKDVLDAFVDELSGEY